MQLNLKLDYMSLADFTALGQNGVAYVKPMRVDERLVYGIFAADGTQIAAAGEREIAFAAIRQHDLEPLDAH